MENLWNNLTGYSFSEDINNLDNNYNTDKILSINYFDFNSNFGESVQIPLLLSELLIKAKESYSGTKINLIGESISGYQIIDDSLELHYNSAPIIANPIEKLVIDIGDEFKFKLPENLFAI